MKSVVNLLRVVPEEPRSDKAIRADAERAVLRWERYGPFDAVGIEVEEGVVRLSGWVETPSKRDEIEERLARVDAIRDVHNDLRVQGFSQGDVRLRREIHGKIYADPCSSAGPAFPTRRSGCSWSGGGSPSPARSEATVEQVAVGMHRPRHARLLVNNQVKVEGDAARKEDRKKETTES